MLLSSTLRIDRNHFLSTPFYVYFSKTEILCSLFSNLGRQGVFFFRAVLSLPVLESDCGSHPCLCPKRHHCWIFPSAYTQETSTLKQLLFHTKPSNIIAVSLFREVVCFSTLSPFLSSAVLRNSHSILGD